MKWYLYSICMSELSSEMNLTIASEILNIFLIKRHKGLIMYYLKAWFFRVDKNYHNYDLENIENEI